MRFQRDLLWLYLLVVEPEAALARPIYFLVAAILVGGLSLLSWQRPERRVEPVLAMLVALLQYAMAYLHNPDVAASTLQRAINAQLSTKTPLVVDGIIGEHTLLLEPAHTHHSLALVLSIARLEQEPPGGTAPRLRACSTRFKQIQPTRPTGTFSPSASLTVRSSTVHMTA